MGLDWGFKFSGNCIGYGADVNGLPKRYEFNKFYGGIIFEAGYLYISAGSKFTISVDIFMKMHSRLYQTFFGNSGDELERNYTSYIFSLGIRLSLGFNFI